MRKSIAVAIAVFFLLLSSGMVSADSKTCNCKHDCKCDATSKESGKCKCDKCTCVKETGLNGKHVCNRDGNCKCNGDCKCNAASDSPRKCGCRHEKKQAI